VKSEENPDDENEEEHINDLATLAEMRIKGAPCTCPVCEFDLGPFPLKSLK
jgi:hypothetical protein